MTTLAVGLIWLILLATPASAHSGGGTDATNFQPRVQSVEPQLPGIEVEVVDNGRRLQVTNRSDQEVVVLGYQDEPYLTVGPDGVFENLRSPATYANRDMDASAAVPGSADPEADPEWSKISDGNQARWHDHRVHWMNSSDPPEVQQDPDRRHTIRQWAVTMQVGDELVEARGDLVWVPGPSAAPWLALIGGLFVVTVAGALSPARRGWVLAALAVAIAVDLVHALGVALAGTSGVVTRLGVFFSGSFVSVTGWALGIFGIVLLARARDGALQVAAVAGAFVALNGGLADVGEIGRSQIFFAWSDALFRVTTAAALGVGLGLLVGCGAQLLLARRAQAPAERSEAQPGTLSR